MITVEELYATHQAALELQLIAANDLSRKLLASEVGQPGLCLAGHRRGLAQKMILIFGQPEIDYLKNMPTAQRMLHLKGVITRRTPAIFVASAQRPLREIVTLCKILSVPLFCSSLSAIQLQLRTAAVLNEACAECRSFHGSLVEIFGIGILIQGDAAVGKSEAALGLIQRGHRLIADDIVKVRRCAGENLEGFGVTVSRHRMEVKGIGIVNIAHLYGMASVREKKSLDIVVKLEVWNDSHFYDRSHNREQTISLLGVKVPSFSLPVKPGRDVVLLLETIALNHRLETLSAIERKVNKKV